MNKETLLKLYDVMIHIREFENEAIELAKSNATRAAVHTYQGEEAIAAGVCAHMTNEDFITSTHRGHGHCIAKGADITKMFAELLGRGEGYCKGKGGSMHIADLATGNLGANGIVGGGIPLALGAGISMQLDKKHHYAVCFFGDGASNEGSFHESLNMAAIWDVPVIFVCENNQYAISTSVEKSLHIKDIADRSVAYGMKGMIVDGNDVVAVYDAMAEAVEHVKAGMGPVLMEMKTYRMTGHYFGDNQNYRTKEEVNAWKAKDPIDHCVALLTDEYGVDPETLKQRRAEVKREVLEASDAAKGMSEPDIQDLTEDLYDPKFADITWVPFHK